MAESKKTKKKTTDFPKAYMRLRTVLDGLEDSALRWCLEEKSSAKRITRIAEVEKMILPVIREMQDKLAIKAPAPGCPDGYFDCGGVCVPYQCP